MASPQVSHTPSLNGSSIPPSRSMSRTRGILLETMQLVEPRKELPVPDHLLESKIYSKVAQNSVVQARPAVIHFGGFELNKTQRVVLRLANISGDVQRMHIIPPQTKYFYIKYTKNDRLVPGLTLDCVLEFTPDEWRYYYDCIRIHTKGEENLIIPIHAYPVMDTSDFPENVVFPPVPVGQTAVQTLPLRLTAPIDFEFQLSVLQHHPAFTIDPLAGVIPANDEVAITVCFTPTEFSTATMKVQLIISQFNSKPLVCTFSGSSVPGLHKMISLQNEGLSTDATDPSLDPRCLSPLDRARSKRRLKMKKNTSATSQTPQIQELEYDGIKFPQNLDTPYSVAQVLNQEPGKLRIKDLREVVLSKKGGSAGSGGAPTRQMKEALFEMAVRQDVYEERQNQLRWQSKLGDDQITANTRLQILKARDAAWHEYKIGRGDPVEEVEYLRKTTDCTFRRTRRDASELAPEAGRFDPYSNDTWAVRHSWIHKFQQAARTIIIRRRADAKIRGLKQMMLDWGSNKYHNTSNAEKKEKDAAEEEELSTLDVLVLSKDRVTSLTFPTYAPPNVKDDMAVDALGQVPYKPTDVVVKKKTPYFGLKVPQSWCLLGYNAHSAQEASQHYISPGLARPLRSGAEDEVITLHPPTPPPPALHDTDLRLEEMETPVPESSAVDTLKPPEALFAPMEYPPLHIFNPSPGLQVFQPPLQYAETDPDSSLCPLPRYISRDASNPHTATQKHYLDREDVVRGVMSWKRFPSQGLTSLANTPTLTNVWVPRWSAGFSSEVLPDAVPEPLEGRPTGEEVMEEEGEEGVVELTPDMVAAQFSLVDGAGVSAGASGAGLGGSREALDTPVVAPVKKEDLFPYGNKMPATNIPVGVNGPVPREQREQELEYFLKKKYNRLGQRIRGRLDTMDNLKTNPDLVLK